jgi:hypothetical protein
MGLHLRGLPAEGVYRKFDARLEEKRLGNNGNDVERTLAVGITYAAKMIAERD